MLEVMTDDAKTIACVLFQGVDPLDLIGPMQALGLLSYLGPGWRVVTVSAGDDLAVAWNQACAGSAAFQRTADRQVALPGLRAGR